MEKHTVRYAAMSRHWLSVNAEVHNAFREEGATCSKAECAAKPYHPDTRAGPPSTMGQPSLSQMPGEMTRAALLMSRTAGALAAVSGAKAEVNNDWLLVPLHAHPSFPATAPESCKHCTVPGVSTMSALFLSHTALAQAALSGADVQI